MTQGQLADLADMQVAQISRYACGGSEPCLSNLCKIVNAFGLELQAVKKDPEYLKASDYLGGCK